jgi:acetyl esterase/lipase
MRESQKRRSLVVAAFVAFVALPFLSACSPITALNALLVPDEGWTVERGLAYGTDERQRLDVYLPAQAALAERPAQVVVWFYGGSWRGGKRRFYRFVGEAFAGRGYVVVIPDYRVYPDVRFPEFLEDGARAVAWIRENAARYGGDPDRIFLMGHSAGAHIAAMLAIDARYLDAAAVDRRAVRGFIGLAGPYAFDPLQYRITRPIFEAAADQAATMPINQVNGATPPMLLLHGGDDGTVYPVNSEALAARVITSGGSARVVEYPDKGHIGIVLALAAPFRRPGGVLDETDRFIRAHSGPTATAAGAAATDQPAHP